MSQATDQTTGVYLAGDPCPLETTLTVAQVAGRIADAGPDPCAFIRLPDTDGDDALVRPSVIVAIVPTVDE